MLDDMDRKILDLLQRDGRAKLSDLSEQIGLSPTPLARRILRLENEGVITGYSARVDQEKMGLPINIFISLELETQSAEFVEKFETAVRQFEEVMECFLMTGSQDILIRAVAPDLHSFERFLQSKLMKVPGIRQIRSRFALRKMVSRTSLPGR